MMHDAVVGTLPRNEIFSNTFYGWPFWLFTFACAFPFFGTGWENEAGVIIASRFVEAFFAGINAALILAGLYRASRNRLEGWQKFWLFLAIPLLLMMPIWWQMAARIHPQQMVLFFELTAAFLLLRDDGRIGRAFWYAVVSASVAFAIKVEAAMLAPMFLAYLVTATYCRRTEIRNAVRAAIFALPVPVAVLFLLNPYMFTKPGLASWIRSNFQNLLDVSSTNYNGHIGILTRLTLLADNFFSLPIILLFLSALAIDAFLTLRRRQFEPSQWLFPYIAVVLILAVCALAGRNQAYYWLAPMVLLLHGLGPLGTWLVRKPIALMAAAGLILASGLAWQMPATAEMMRHRASNQIYSVMQGRWVDLDFAKRVASSQAQTFAAELRHARRPIISPYADISFRDLGIRYVDRVYGCLSAEVLGPIHGRVPKPAADLVILRKNDPALHCDMATLSRWRLDGMTFRKLKETPYLRAYGLRGT